MDHPTDFEGTLPAGAGFSSETNATLAFISGRRCSLGFSTFTLICTVAFCRFASGEISLIEAGIFEVGERVGGDYAALAGMQLREIVLADVELDFEVVQISQRDHVAL
jgi:hypothetical protein